VLALVAEPAGALADAETARLAEIVAPRIFARWPVRLVAARAAALRMYEGRRFQGKADLRIGGQVGGAGLLGRAAARDDAAGRTEGEIGRTLHRPFTDLRRPVDARP